MSAPVVTNYHALIKKKLFRSYSCHVTLHGVYPDVHVWIIRQSEARARLNPGMLNFCLPPLALRVITLSFPIL